MVHTQSSWAAGLLDGDCGLTSVPWLPVIRPPQAARGKSWDSSHARGKRWDTSHAHAVQGPGIRLLNHLPCETLTGGRASECISGWMSEWVSDLSEQVMSGWMSGWASKWVSEWMSELVNELVIWVNKWWVGEWVGERVSEWVNEWVSEWVSAFRINRVPTLLGTYRKNMEAARTPAVRTNFLHNPSRHFQGRGQSTCVFGAAFPRHMICCTGSMATTIPTFRQLGKEKYVPATGSKPTSGNVKTAAMTTRQWRHIFNVAVMTSQITQISHECSLNNSRWLPYNAAEYSSWPLRHYFKMAAMQRCSFQDGCHDVTIPRGRRDV